MDFMERVKGLSQRKRRLMGHNRLMRTAVLLPLLEQKGQTFILFEKRSRNLRRQAGEICFPGGSLDPEDKGAASAAVRETCEELGLVHDDIQLIAPLDILFTPTDLIIYPFIGNILNPNHISPNDEEVESLLYVPVKHLLEQEPLCKKKVHIKPVKIILFN